MKTFLDYLKEDLRKWFSKTDSPSHIIEGTISSVTHFFIPLEEKNIPTSPEKWSRAKALARSKFKVYPSAYANGWASKRYKAMGGGWKTG